MAEPLLWKYMEPPLPAPRSIEEKERELLSLGGPTLQNLMDEAFDCPFKKIKAKNCLSVDSRASDQSEEIIIRNGQSSNLRAFYYMLLYACFGRSDRTDLRSSQLLRNFKTFAYAESTLLEPYARQYNHRRFFKILNTNSSMKKILVEALQLLSKSKTVDICLLIQENPILDCIFLCVIRCLAVTHHQYLPQLKAIDKAISTDILVNSFRKQFAVRIEYMPFGDIVFEECFVMREQKQYTYLRRFTESIIDSTDWKKTSESSSSHGFGNILDISKSFADISIIQPKSATIQQDPPRSMRSVDPVPSRQVFKGLSGVRRCDSIAGDQLQGLDSKRKTSRESKEGPYKCRQAQSERDDDSNDSSASCVIYKVEFGQPGSKTPPPVSPRKQLTPRRAPKIIERDMNKNSSIEDLHLKHNSNHQKVTSPPKINIISPPDAPRNYDSLGNEAQQRLMSKLYTIPSVEDSCIEESMIGPMVEDINCENMKDRLCEGTTSEAVLKILSPSVARIVLRKKEESVKNLIDNIQSKTSLVSSIRSINNGSAEPSDRMSTKIDRQFGDFNRRTSIGGNTFSRLPFNTTIDFRRKEETNPRLPSTGNQLDFKKQQYQNPAPSRQRNPQFPVVPRLAFGASVRHKSNLDAKPVEKTFQHTKERRIIQRFTHEIQSDSSISPEASSRTTPRQPFQYFSLERKLYK